MLSLVLLSACATAPPRATPSPSVPPVPLVEGRLAPRVVHPAAGALIGSQDSSFIFGSVGHGRAILTINGITVPVLPNGSFIAYLPNPTASTPHYELVAALGRDTARLTHPVRLLPARVVLSDTGLLVVDTSSVTPRGPLMVRDDEPVRVSVRAPPNVSAWVSWYGGAQPLVNDAARARLIGAGTSGGAAVSGDRNLWATDVPAYTLGDSAALMVARGPDTIRLELPRVVSASGAALPRWALLNLDSGALSDTDRVVVARPTPGGTYKWFLLPGTQVAVTGRIREFVRVRLDSLLEVWVAARDLRPLPVGFAGPRRVAGNPRLVAAEHWVDLVIPLGASPPFAVEPGARSLTLTLYGTQSAADIITYGGTDLLVRLVTWEQQTSDRVRYTLDLSSPPFGYLTFWDRGAFVLRVRRPPGVDPGAPLRGLTIAVDPGHPPVGATGPTGLYEPVSTLAVGLRLKDLLEARGAAVVMTRTTAAAVPLTDRPVIARRANAHALVSIHLNALPDGVNPFGAHGTGTYFFHPQAASLARAIQNGMLASMGLRDLGVYYDNLALTRPTWMPAVLCEGAFIMMPEQEAALRTPEFQEAYARGVADGLEAFFRSLATSR